MSFFFDWPRTAHSKISLNSFCDRFCGTLWKNSFSSPLKTLSKCLEEKLFYNLWRHNSCLLLRSLTFWCFQSTLFAFLSGWLFNGSLLWCRIQRWVPCLRAVQVLLLRALDFRGPRVGCDGCHHLLEGVAGGQQWLGGSLLAGAGGWRPLGFLRRSGLLSTSFRRGQPVGFV